MRLPQPPNYRASTSEEEFSRMRGLQRQECRLQRSQDQMLYWTPAVYVFSRFSMKRIFFNAEE